MTLEQEVHQFLKELPPTKFFFLYFVSHNLDYNSLKMLAQKLTDIVGFKIIINSVCCSCLVFVFRSCGPRATTSRCGRWCARCRARPPPSPCTRPPSPPASCGGSPRCCRSARSLRAAASARCPRLTGPRPRPPATGCSARRGSASRATPGPSPDPTPPPDPRLQNSLLITLSR